MSSYSVKLKISFIFVLSVFFIFLGVSNSYAATYYVSPTGSASWSQSQSINSPASLTTAMASAIAGDTVNFRGGTYRIAKVTPEGTGLRPAVFPANDGQKDKEIVFKAYNGEAVFFDNSANQGSATTVPTYGTFGNSYIIWDGINTKAIPDGNQTGRGVSIASHSSNIVVRNAAIEGYPSGKSNNNCIRIEKAKNILIENCKIWNANSNTGADHNCSGIELYAGEDVTVRKCDIFNCYTGVYDKNNATRNNYYQNHLYNLKKGFLINGKWDIADNVSIFKNIIRNCSVWGVELFDATNGGSLVNAKIYNNTFYNNSGNAFTGDDGNEYGTEFFNNVVYGAATAVRFFKAPAFADYNCYFEVSKLAYGTVYSSLAAWNSSTVYDRNSISQNPELKNPGSASPSDYMPLIGSPCIGAGRYGQTIGAYANASDTLTVGYRSGGSSQPEPTLGIPQNLHIVTN
jgi:hypothetical protein